MRHLKITAILLLATLLSGCSLNKEYHKGLSRNLCYYNHDNIVYKSRNGTCSFLADTIYSTAYNNKSYTLLFSSLSADSGYMNVFEVTKQNTPEIISLFKDFIAWSELEQPQMQIEEFKFNNSENSKKQVATSASAKKQFQYISKPPKTLGYEEYENSPLMLIQLNLSLFGFPMTDYWLITPEDARKLIVLIQILSADLD
jgi:outer membrane protein assembly factor BamE (lipoprotein component of BamABCDE complex)